MTPAKRVLAQRILALCEVHDRLERAILLEARKLTDKELREMGLAAGG